MNGTLLGFHASHEQLSPRQGLDAVQAAAAAGFDTAMCSDHYAPWTERQGHAGHAWSWLGAAMQATTVPFGVVTAPGQRYHPAVIAQAIATLAELFPDRLWVALGSGENLNEHITGGRWPSKEERDDRLTECAHIIKALLAGEVVTHHGLVDVDRARIWSLPPRPPALFGAAVGSATAARVASWADGMITVNQPLPKLRETIEAFRDGAGDKPVHIQVHLSWADTMDEALDIAFDQWRCGLVPAHLAWELAMPDEFEAVASLARRDDITSAVNVSADVEQHIAWIHELLELRPAAIYLHHVGKQQQAFIDTFGTKVLPRCRG